MQEFPRRSCCFCILQGKLFLFTAFHRIGKPWPRAEVPLTDTASACYSTGNAAQPPLRGGRIRGEKGMSYAPVDLESARWSPHCGHPSRKGGDSQGCDCPHQSRERHERGNLSAPFGTPG